MEEVGHAENDESVGKSPERVWEYGGLGCSGSKDRGMTMFLMRVWGSGICGTDVHIYQDDYRAYEEGLIIGHEFSAVVEAVGRNVRRVKPGDRVVSCPRDAGGDDGK